MPKACKILVDSPCTQPAIQALSPMFLLVVQHFGVVNINETTFLLLCAEHFTKVYWLLLSKQVSHCRRCALPWRASAYLVGLMLLCFITSQASAIQGHWPWRPKPRWYKESTSRLTSHLLGWQRGWQHDHAACQPGPDAGPRHTECLQEVLQSGGPHSHWRGSWSGCGGRAGRRSRGCFGRSFMFHALGLVIRRRVWGKSWGILR